MREQKHVSARKEIFGASRTRRSARQIKSRVGGEPTRREEPLETDRLGGAINSTGRATQNEDQAEILARLDEINLILDWQSDWIDRSSRAQLCLELIGLSRARHDALISEGRAIQLCMIELVSEMADA